MEPPITGAFKELKRNLEILAQYVQVISNQTVPRFGSFGGKQAAEFDRLRQELNLPSDAILAWLPPEHRDTLVKGEGYWINGLGFTNSRLTTDPIIPFIIVRDMMAAAYFQSPFLTPPMPLYGEEAVLTPERTKEFFEGA